MPGAGEHVRERLDRRPVARHVGGEVAEVVLEREVDDGIRVGGALLQDVQVVERAAQDIRAHRRHLRGPFI